MRFWSKTVEQEDPELTSYHRYTKIPTTYRTTIQEKDQDLAEKIYD